MEMYTLIKLFGPQKIPMCINTQSVYFPHIHIFIIMKLFRLYFLICEMRELDWLTLRNFSTAKFSFYGFSSPLRYNFIKYKSLSLFIESTPRLKAGIASPVGAGEGRKWKAGRALAVS